MKILIILFSLISFQNAIAAGVEGQLATGAATSAATKKVAQTATETVAPGLIDRIGNFMSSPPGIVIVAGIGLANSATLYSAAAEQEKLTEDNIKKVERILAEFKDSYANFCPKGREDVQDPNCYCYLDNGKQNPNRTNSQQCQQLWAKNKYMYDSTVGSYAGSDADDPSGCLTVKGEFDEDCTCKKMFNSSGQNACKKTIALNVSGNPLGVGYVKASGLEHVMQNLAQTASGNSNLDSLSTKKLGLAIAKQGDINSGIIAKLPPNQLALIKDGNQIEGYQNAAFTKADLAKSSISSGGALAMNSPSGLSSDQMKALKDVSKKTGIELNGGNGLGVKKAGKKEEFNFMDAGSNTAQAGQVQSFPESEKNYKYKNSDIVTDQGASIFEIISNRYVESGLRRLFDSDEAEKEAK